MDELITTIRSCNTPRDAANYFAKVYFAEERQVAVFDGESSTFKLVGGIATYKVILIKGDRVTPAHWQIRKIALV